MAHWHYLTGETKASGDTAHCDWHKVVQVSISWFGKLQSSEAHVVQSFIVDAVRFIGILNQLMDWQCSVVRLHNCVRYFWWWYDAECAYNAVAVFFMDLWNEKRSHSRAGSTAQGVRELKSLKTIAAFCFFANDIEYRIYQFGSFCVMSFCPVVSSTALT